MLNVCTPEEAKKLIFDEFSVKSPVCERIPLHKCLGRVLGEAVTADEYVPDFDRSTVDGYAVTASDTFGCSDAIPALLTLVGDVKMGEAAKMTLNPGECVYVPTGAQLPHGADAVVMIEYSEDYGDGTIGLSKPAAPGLNVIRRGDDVFPGKPVLSAGRRLRAEDIGALAAMGRAEVCVRAKPRIAVLSTGDELVPITEKPALGQVRNVNSVMLCAAIEGYGAEAVDAGVIKDNKEALLSALRSACSAYDAVIVSGGSSVGMKDATCAVIGELGTLLLHGLAMKPGKPSILGKIGGKPVVGLPGHPAAAFFVTEILVKELVSVLLGTEAERSFVPAVLTEAVSANHGRAQYTSVRLIKDGGTALAVPIRSKSGLVSSLAGADGYFCIDRDSEGCAKGETITVYLR